MAKLKTAKNLIQNRDEYARYFSDFRGVDFSSDHTDVADNRFAYAVNMWRDYKSGEGGAVETIPGFRRVREFSENINGVHFFKDNLIVHHGSVLEQIAVYSEEKKEFVAPKAEVEATAYTVESSESFFGKTSKILLNSIPQDVIPTWISGVKVEGVEIQCTIRLTKKGMTFDVLGDVKENGVITFLQSGDKIEIGDKPSKSIEFNDRLYVINGESFVEWTGERSDLSTPRKSSFTYIQDKAHVPTTHHLIYPGSKDPEISLGVEREQRNILTPKYKNKFIAGHYYDPEKDGSIILNLNKFQLKYGSDYEGDCHSATTQYPEGIEVYQYGVKLPYAEYTVGVDTKPRLPKGFPNAVVYFEKSGKVALLNVPPNPENNTWNPDIKAFDYTDEEIRNGKPAQDGYRWPWAYPAGHDGIEIVAENAITNINGIEAKDGYASIITKCTIATVFDNRLFLSGNPDFPTHIFWSGLNGETDYPDPTYFGITNNDIEGVTSAPVTALLPVADQLMVLKKENPTEGSVIFHTPTIGDDDVMPKLYPSTQGLAGRGCLGAACNFLDDPVFISKYGLEAMGSYTNAKYERSIEHRSSLIDAKLLGCDLSKAQLIEYEGYLLLLVGGKMFMADSRATFTHQSGVMQYEWFYLEDIGVWEGQKEEFVYAKFPIDVAIPSLIVEEATNVYDELGVPHDLIGETVDESLGKIEWIRYFGADVGYVQNRNKGYTSTGQEALLKPSLYVEKNGAMIGGTFVPAERLYVIGSDLYFSVGKHLCKFNFDKRDKDTGIIPVEYYSFDGRTIFSGCATKMDNCGIPHLTKNTVKRSTVIKTRTFTHSNAKIKVRTNRKAFEQVGRIINGTEVFEGMNFADFTFNVDGKTLFSVNEKEKKWVEKQHFIYSDGYCEPFAIHYIAYRYNVAGRYKE